MKNSYIIFLIILLIFGINLKSLNSEIKNQRKEILELKNKLEISQAKIKELLEINRTLAEATNFATAAYNELLKAKSDKKENSCQN